MVKKDKEIQVFLEGYSDRKYIVHVEVKYNQSDATCIRHHPNGLKDTINIPYNKFIYIKDFRLNTDAEGKSIVFYQNEIQKRSLF